MQIFADKVFSDASHTILAFEHKDVEKAFDEIEKYAKTHFLVGYVRYELKDFFIGKQLKKSLFPLIFFQAFKKFDEYKFKTFKDVNFSICEGMAFCDYAEDIKKVKKEIKQGNTYQVNLTYPNKVFTTSDSNEIFNFLINRQKSPYGALIENEWETVISTSPELFFAVKEGRIIARPMKGTIGRGSCIITDERNKKFLMSDKKNMSENVMIVDLIRNDISKIVKDGIVKVDKIFEVESYDTVHQMVSEISGELDDRSTLIKIFEAMFPCGSVTGAPKISTMNIIENIEKEPRGIYCGAIGFIHGNEMLFSVPIRILQKARGEKFFTYNVGSGITWESDVSSEWIETKVKMEILKGKVELVETAEVRDNKIVFIDEHIERVRTSAKKLDYKFDENLIRGYKPRIDGMLRILLSKDGNFEFEMKEIRISTSNLVRISPILTDSKEDFLRHKTTYRPWYDESLSKINRGELFDEIYFNSQGELTEGSRTNILLKIGGRLYTPPCECGLLNGIYRDKLIRENKCEERILFKEDLIKAEKIFCCNSVRGLVEVRLSR